MQPPANLVEKENFLSKYLNLYQPKKDEAVDSGYALASNPAKNKDILSKVISDRISFLKKSIEEIQEQIQERQKLKHALVFDIDANLCQTKTELYELISLSTIANSLNSNRSSSLETLIAALNKEKRHQQLLHWQETVMLERELREMEMEMLSAVRDLWMVGLLS